MRKPCLRGWGRLELLLLERVHGSPAWADFDLDGERHLAPSKEASQVGSDKS